MKSIVTIVFFILINTSLMAAEYAQVIVKCEIRTTEQDIYNKERTLPHYLNLQYFLSFDPNTHKYIKGRHQADLAIQSTTGADRTKLDRAAGQLKINFVNGSLYNVRVDFDKDSIAEILLHAGSYRVAYNNLTMTDVKGHFAFDAWAKAQTHQEVNIDHGVSFHLWMFCKAHYPVNFPQKTIIQGGFIQDNYLQTKSTTEDGWTEVN